MIDEFIKFVIFIALFFGYIAVKADFKKDRMFSENEKT
jgi:hypothetical protein